MKTEPSAYRSFRFPAAISSHAVWLHHRFGLSLREIETILAQRGSVVSYESTRAWGLHFGRAILHASASLDIVDSTICDSHTPRVRRARSTQPTALS